MKRLPFRFSQSRKKDHSCQGIIVANARSHDLQSQFTIEPAAKGVFTNAICKVIYIKNNLISL